MWPKKVLVQKVVHFNSFVVICVAFDEKFIPVLHKHEINNCYYSSSELVTDEEDEF